MLIKAHTLVETMLSLSIALLVSTSLNVSFTSRLNFELLKFSDTYLHTQFLAIMTHRDLSLPEHYDLFDEPSFNAKGNLASAYRLNFKQKTYSLSFITGKFYESSFDDD